MTLRSYRMDEISEKRDNRRENIEEYYYRLDVQYEIVKQLKNRECAILVPSWVEDYNSKRKSVRNLKVHSPQYLQQAIKRLNFNNKKNYEMYNLYGSVGVYKNGVPFTTLQLSNRDTTDWKRNHYKSMIGYDFFLDIDAGSSTDVKFALKSAVMICDYLTVFECPYSLRFSGRGFHIIIPYNYFKYNDFDPSNENSIYKKYYKIAKYLHDKFSEMIDLKIYDSRRVFKLAYSLSHYRQQSYICWPFESMHELDNFEIEDYTLSALKTKKVRGRGVWIFNENGNTKRLLQEIKGVEDGK